MKLVLFQHDTSRKKNKKKTKEKTKIYQKTSVTKQLSRRTKILKRSAKYAARNWQGPRCTDTQRGKKRTKRQTGRQTKADKACNKIVIENEWQ